MKYPRHALPFLLLTAAVAPNVYAAVTATNDSAMTTQGSPVVIDVLANDTSDLPDPTTLTIGSYTEETAAYGTVVLNEDQTLTYTPSDDFTGEDVFEYLAEDGSGYGDWARVYITVSEAEPEPEPEEESTALETHATGQRNLRVARMLDNVCADGEAPSEALSSACNDLFAQVNESPESINSVIAEIAPDELVMQRRMLSDMSRNRTSRLHQSLAQQRQSGQPVSLSLNGRALAPNGSAGDAFNSPWSLISSVQIERTERSETEHEAAYKSRGNSVLLGAIYRLNSQLSLGGALGKDQHKVDFSHDAGSLDADIYSATGFISWYSDQVRGGLQIGYATGSSDSERHFSTLGQGSAYAENDSKQYDLSLQVEWDTHQGAWSLRPYLRLDYANTRIDGFTETGSNAWLMTVGKQKLEQVSASLGVDTSYTIGFSWGVMIPSIGFSLVSQSDLSDDSVNFRLAGYDDEAGTFQLQSNTEDSLFNRWDVNTAFVLPHGFSAYLSGQYFGAYDYINSYRLGGGINWEF